MFFPYQSNFFLKFEKKNDVEKKSLPKIELCFSFNFLLVLYCMNREIKLQFTFRLTNVFHSSIQCLTNILRIKQEFVKYYCIF